MLAAIDGDTESEDSFRGQKSHRSASNQKERDSSLEISNDARHGASLKKYDESEGDESEDAPVIPMGRLAARLHERAKQINSTTNAGETFDGNAYERLKEKLLARTTFSPEGISNNSMRDVSADTALASSLGTLTHKIQPRSESESSPSFRSAVGIQRASPGLSLMPKTTAGTQLSSATVTEASSDSDIPADPFQIIFARKQEELQAKKEAEAQKKAERKAQIQSLSTKKLTQLAPASSGISESDSDNHSDERRLTQQARPTRKASKKALEEMNRETQRMSRNMQLAHEAKTKKKISKESFFTRFNFRASPVIAEAAQAVNSSTVVSSALASDAEGNHRSSPPTSPAGTVDPLRKSIEPSESHGGDSSHTAEGVQGIVPRDLYILDQRQFHEEQDKSSKAIDKGPALASRSTTPADSSRPSNRPHTSKPRFLRAVRDFESDSDLEIIPSKKPKRSKLDIFQRLPTGNLNEERLLQTLRVLAQVNSPGKHISGFKSSMTMSDMQMSLQQRARKQAAAERAERIRDLKERGVIIQTAEEREKDQADVEDLVDKARREARDIMEKEKRIARKEKLANGELDGTALTSDEDEDYQGNDADESDINLSGSDEEQDQEDGQSSGSDTGEDEGGAQIFEGDDTSRLFVDAEASEDGQEEGEPTSEEHEYQAHEMANAHRSKRRRRTHLVIQDDEDETDECEVQQCPVNRSQTIQQPQIPGLPYNALPMGMTQAFGATMADTQPTEMGQSASQDPKQDSLAFLGPMPEPNFPVYDFEETQQMVLDSQHNNASDTFDVENTKSQDIEIHFSQDLFQHNTFEDTQDVPMSTQYSEIPDPTQDVGFTITSPIQNRFVSVPPSTVETVLLSDAMRNSPMVKKKGRLRRRVEALDVANIDEEDVPSRSGLARFDVSIDAFNVMKKAARKAVPTVDSFDKDNSEVKAMVEEQAQESDDEYAGLGGISDDESAQEGDDEVRKMIDEGEVEVDEGNLAAFYA